MLSISLNYTETVTKLPVFTNINTHEDMTMKSAYELALERTGGSLEELPEDKKAGIAEIERKQKAKLAEAELSAKSRTENAEGNQADIDQINEDLVTELASINFKFEKEKKQVRNG